MTSEGWRCGLKCIHEGFRSNGERRRDFPLSPFFALLTQPPRVDAMNDFLSAAYVDVGSTHAHHPSPCVRHAVHLSFRTKLSRSRSFLLNAIHHARDNALRDLKNTCGRDATECYNNLLEFLRCVPRLAKAVYKSTKGDREKVGGN